MDKDHLLPLLSPRISEQQVSFAPPPPPPPVTLSPLPEDDVLNLSVTPSASSFKDLLIFGPSISSEDPHCSSSSSLLEALTLSFSSPKPSSSPLCENPFLEQTPRHHHHHHHHLLRQQQVQVQAPQQQHQWPIDSNQPPRTKTNLHRSKTAPAMSTIDDVQSRKLMPKPYAGSNSIVRQAVVLLIIYLSLGVLIYWLGRHHFAANETHPAVDALYFCIVTMCTIGYGDITPNSTATKIFSVLFVLIGFGFVDILLSGMVSHVLDMQENYLLRTVNARKDKANARSIIIDVKKGRMRIRMKVGLALGVVVLCIGIGAGVVHFVEQLGWLDSVYLSVMSVTTVGYGDHAFKTLPGRAFAAIWLLVSTLAVARAFLYLAEARVDKRHRTMAKWVLGQDMTVAQFLAADMDNNGFVSSQQKKQIAKKFSHQTPQLDTQQLPISAGDVKLDGAGNPDLGDSVPTSIGVDGGETLSNIQLEDFIGMIKSAEKNILLINQARLRALEDLESIGEEKEALQGEINNLEMRLAETDAKIRVAAQQKIHMELLEKQLEEMRKELSNRSGSQRTSNFDTNWMHDQNSASKPPQFYKDEFLVLTEELSSLKAENVSLKDGMEALWAELSSIKTTDKRVVMLENKRSHLASSVDDLGVKLDASEGDVTQLSSLKLEYRSLWEKIEGLQSLLDKATRQAEEATSILQQNQELRKKVERLEEYLQEASAFKLSSEKIQRYQELMQQKVKLLEERLHRSDEEIHSYVKLYKESMEGFQDSLNSLKEERKSRDLDEPVDDMPWEFWSSLLLLVDGWLLEGKITSNNAELLKEMVLKRDRRICDAYLACKEKDEQEALSILLRLTSNSTSSGLHIIHIAAEMAPVAKVGGLGDVVTGLGKALQKKGHHVEIVLPKYDCMQYDFIHDLRALNLGFKSYFDKQLFDNKIWVGTVEGLPVYFIEPLHPSKFFWRGQYYGEPDDFKRFSFFSRAALELLFQAGKKPDIIHCHDWQTAFVAPLYWEIYVHKGMNSARICFTCHNFEYQGTAPASELASCGLDVDHLNRPDRMRDNATNDLVNPVKGAVVFSNIVTTVSPTYAEEVLSPEGGRGLHTTLNSQKRKFIGVLNGIDTDSWNPATDGFLIRQYESSDIQGKLENKKSLRKHLCLSSADVTQPLVGCITRLVPQKGVHLIRHAIYRTLELGGQFVLLGSSPVHHIQREFEGIASHFQSHEHARLVLKYDDSLAHLIYAASDMFIIPSMFEPCGLTQMIAMRYGSIPIARKTGGLNDSVFDVDDKAIPVKFQNGFTFFTPDEQGLNSALDRAFHLYKNNRESWQWLVQKVMKIDFSWNSSALQYEELYQRAVARARAAKL